MADGGLVTVAHIHRGLGHVGIQLLVRNGSGVLHVGHGLSERGSCQMRREREGVRGHSQLMLARAVQLAVDGVGHQNGTLSCFYPGSSPSYLMWLGGDAMAAWPQAHLTCF